MYRILIADDEGIVVNSLSFIIEKNFPGEYELETVKSGRMAIEVAERFRPDIVFMDIHMPGINGIDAMREIRKSYTSAIFIVLTAYDKFDYAKEAINLGVMEYLNKPVNQKVVVDVIRRAMAEIDTRREKQKNDLQIKERLETVVPVIENGFIYCLLFHERFEEDLDNYRDLLGIEAESGYMMAVVFGDTLSGTHMTNAVGASVQTQTMYYASVREILKDTFPECIVGNVMSNKIPVFMPFEGSKMDYNQRIDIIERARNSVHRMNKTTGIVFRLGIGSVERSKEMMQSYDGALKALYNSKGGVAHVDDLPISAEYEESYPVDTEQKLFEKIQDGKVDECIVEAGRYYDWMQSKYGEEEMSIKLKILEFVMKAETIMYHSTASIYRFDSRKDYLQEVFFMKDVASLRNWFTEKIADAARRVATSNEDHTNHLIKKALEYIGLHFQKDISLDEIARELNISPYYFSKLFKDETGQGYIEYVTEQRMKQAKELLRNPEKSIKEIGMEVGYSDPNYFSRIFKKYQGVTPTEYREQA